MPSHRGAAVIVLVWAGKPDRIFDHRRSIALQQLAPLADVPGVSFISLQKGDAAGQTRQSPFPIHDWTDQLHDFADIAALVSDYRRAAGGRR
jgi:hypothetical protein